MVLGHFHHHNHQNYHHYHHHHHYHQLELDSCPGNAHLNCFFSVDAFPLFHFFFVLGKGEKVEHEGFLKSKTCFHFLQHAFIFMQSQFCETSVRCLTLDKKFVARYFRNKMATWSNFEFQKWMEGSNASCLSQEQLKMEAMLFSDIFDNVGKENYFKNC